MININALKLDAFKEYIYIYKFNQLNQTNK